jgi:hypothetical protein
MSQPDLTIPLIGVAALLNRDGRGRQFRLSMSETDPEWGVTFTLARAIHSQDRLLILTSADDWWSFGPEWKAMDCKPLKFMLFRHPAVALLIGALDDVR